MNVKNLWPFTIRIAIEFDSVDVQQMWWLPWFHTWDYGFRIGIFGIHLILGISFYHLDKSFSDMNEE